MASNRVSGSARRTAAKMTPMPEIAYFVLYSAAPARLASPPMSTMTTKRTKTIKKPIGGLLEVCAR
jgi:hypothetical protein